MEYFYLRRGVYDFGFIGFGWFFFDGFVGFIGICWFFTETLLFDYLFTLFHYDYITLLLNDSITVLAIG